MANINQVNGLVPMRTLSGADNNQQVMKFATSTSDTTAIYVGDPVKLGGGADSNGIPFVAQGTAAAAIAGVVVGVEVDGSKLQTPYREGSTARYVYVNTDPNQIYVAQASAAVTLANSTKNASITVGTGNTTTGASGVQIDATTAATTATLELALLGFPYDMNNTPNATYNKLLCKINVSQFANGRTGV